MLIYYHGTMTRWENIVLILVRRHWFCLNGCILQSLFYTVPPLREKVFTFAKFAYIGFKLIA